MPDNKEVKISSETNKNEAPKSKPELPKIDITQRVSEVFSLDLSLKKTDKHEE